MSFNFIPAVTVSVILEPKKIKVTLASYLVKYQSQLVGFCAEPLLS